MNGQGWRPLSPKELLPAQEPSTLTIGRIDTVMDPPGWHEAGISSLASRAKTRRVGMERMKRRKKHYLYLHNLCIVP